MRSLTLSLLFIIQFVSVNTHAQEKRFAPLGATWYYKIENIFTGTGGYAKLTVTKDTVINGRQCAIITGKQFYSNAPNKAIDIDSSLILTQDSLKVLYYTNGKFTTLYDFGAKTGDTWITEESSETNTTTVLTVDSVSISGKKQKRLIVKYSNSPKQDTIIEKVGALYNFIPIERTKQIRFSFEGLNCYSDSSLSFKNISSSCETVLKVGINENKKINNLITVFPNPFSSVISLKYQAEGISSNLKITITDLTGKIIHLQQTGLSNEINLEHLKQGTYLLRLDAPNMQYHQTLIKE